MKYFVEITWKSGARTGRYCQDYPAVLFEIADIHHSASQESFKEVRIIPDTEIEIVKKADSKN